MIKQVFFICCLFSSLITFSQDSTNVKAETPKIVAKLFLGKTYHIQDVQITFSDVLSDSRCPEDVTCVWAGEVAVLVDITRDNVLLEQKKLVFEPGKTSDKDFGILFSSKYASVKALAVMPSLSSNKKTEKEAYYLQLEITKKE